MMAENIESTYRVCRGGLFVNGERIPVHRRALKIGLVAAGLDTDACEDLSDRTARRILHLERSILIAQLTEELRDALGSDRAA